MGDYITTYTGIHFTPTEPNKDDICIKDIAHALSLVCRGNGHTNRFFSVGQHCINCSKEAAARGYSKKVQLIALLHDASEAYMSDITRPFKRHLADYIEFENVLQSLIYEKYIVETIEAREEEQVKSIDDDMLYYEIKELMNEVTLPMPPAMSSNICLRTSEFEKVEYEFLDIYNTLI